MYNGAGDHFTHEVSSLIVVGPTGLDWHFNNGTNQTVLWEEDNYYSTIAFTDKVIEMVEEHDTSQVRFLDVSTELRIHQREIILYFSG